MLDLTVVIVNWNVRDLLRACLRSLEPELAGCEAEVIVVDNASRDGSVDMVRAEFPAVRVVENDYNAGFGTGNNQGLALSEGRAILFLNPDTEVRPGSIMRLLAFMDQRPQAGCVGPRLVNPDGTTQPSRRGFPRFSLAFVESTVLQRYLGGLRGLRRFYFEHVPDGQAHTVDWVVGACMLCRKEAIEAIHGFDERFFMYSEEMDLCYRLRKRGYQVWYVPEAEVMHHEGASSRQDVFRRNVNFFEGRFRFFRKHGAPWQAELLRAWVMATFIFQLVEETAKFALRPAKRDLRRQRIRLYTRIVTWYLSGS